MSLSQIPLHRVNFILQLEDLLDLAVFGRVEGFYREPYGLLRKAYHDLELLHGKIGEGEVVLDLVFVELDQVLGVVPDPFDITHSVDVERERRGEDRREADLHQVRRKGRDL